MVAALPLGIFITILAFLLAMAAVVVFAGLRARTQAAAIRATPTSPVGLTEDGYRAFEGRAEAVDGALTAPLTTWSCCWYHARVEQYATRRVGDRDEGHWTLVEEWTSGSPLLVRDGTGGCAVDPYLADVTPTDKSLWYGATAVPVDRNPPKVGPAESTHGMVEVSGTANTRFRYSEERIYAGDPLFVLGGFTSGRFASSAPDEEDDEPEDLDQDAPDDDEPADPHAAARIAALEREDAAHDRARSITRSRIGHVSGRPFVIAAAARDRHVAMMAGGSRAALGLAAVPVGLILLLLWARFG
ncbi:MAG: hypothetical protein R2712_08130 [Vicinamibacterales bacterium]